MLRKAGNHLTLALDFSSTTTSKRHLPDGLIGLRSEEDFSVENYHNQVVALEESGTPNRVRIRFQHVDYCLAAESARTWAVPCGEESDKDRITFEIREGDDGTFGLESVYWNTTKSSLDCLHYHPDAKSSLVNVKCGSENNAFDRASRPLRLSPSSAIGTCLTSRGTSSHVGLEECDPLDENQKFTYLFGVKQWVQQKKVIIDRVISLCFLAKLIRCIPVLTRCRILSPGPSYGTPKAIRQGRRSVFI